MSRTCIKINTIGIQALCCTCLSILLNRLSNITNQNIKCRRSDSESDYITMNTYENKSKIV